ncbi:A24 family peptidase [Aureliella helgolandensis]|nr:A24 family peptidase [Aureliella helgolandensis]
MESIISQLSENGAMWAVSVTLVIAAVIDGLYLKVPNKITYPLILAGWIYSTAVGGWAGLGWSLAATFFGLALLFGLHLIGGMGAGDVKLLAGIAAFVHIEHTWYIFVATTIVGAIMAIAQIAISGDWVKHWTQAQALLHEIVTVRNADKLYEISQERKPRMRLLPYGIPMTVAAIGYFAFAGLI